MTNSSKFEYDEYVKDLTDVDLEIYELIKEYVNTSRIYCEHQKNVSTDTNII